MITQIMSVDNFFAVYDEGDKFAYCKLICWALKDGEIVGIDTDNSGFKGICEECDNFVTYEYRPDIKKTWIEVKK